MLTATLNHSAQTDIEEILLGQGFHQTGSVYILRELAKAKVSPGRVEFSFPGNLTLDQYEQIHQAIKGVHETAAGQLDDSASLLGYLQDGQGAYIVTNWDRWRTFLLKARHTSMEGQKVRVSDSSGQHLGSGILVGYELDAKDETRFQVVSCTLITTFGERTYTGQNLKIEPTGEW